MPHVQIVTGILPTSALQKLVLAIFQLLSISPKMGPVGLMDGEPNHGEVVCWKAAQKLKISNHKQTILSLGSE